MHGGVNCASPYGLCTGFKRYVLFVPAWRQQGGRRPDADGIGIISREVSPCRAVNPDCKEHPEPEDPLEAGAAALIRQADVQLTFSLFNRTDRSISMAAEIVPSAPQLYLGICQRGDCGHKLRMATVRRRRRGKHQQKGENCK
jgi:hypothetical protein